MNVVLGSAKICDMAEQEADESRRRSLLCDLERWAKRRPPNRVAHRLGISMARVRSLKGGDCGRLSVGELTELACRAGLRI
ncbi:hypothetical protein MOX02_59000 [Methylobacterium oxalidis]|uniref:HigA2-like helix-turn-helix domain-containing protein n=1 Tax=Methylobacterium oxalidis TaxID=944322 RepID=A0A512JD16_9HYPH|nr:hypothetical protein MOX02_59000 [Methylobacterium oxalidis]